MELVKTSKKRSFLNPFWTDLFNQDGFFDNRMSLLEPVFSAPPVNVIENGDYFKIELAVPGFSKEDLVVETNGNILSVSAEKKEESEKKEEHYTRNEFSYESFERSFTLPQICDDSKIDAHYAEGILSLVIPKKESRKGNSKKAIRIK